MAKKAVQVQLRNRVVERRRMKVSDLLPNERNPRRHPQLQREALTDILHEVGQVGELYAYPSERAGGKLVLIDGHLRRDLDPNQEWDVAVTDLTDAEAAKVLATFDPLGALATRDDAAWQALLAEVETESEAVRAMLELLVFNVDGVDAPILPDGDRAPFQQMTFTLHDEQAEQVTAALKKAMAMGPFVDSPNENSNGNALARVCEVFLGTS